MKFGSHEWYLYHDKKNEDPVIPLIVLSCLVFFVKLGILFIAIIWFYYFNWARENNKKLDNDPEILESRLYYIKLRNEGKIE